MDRETSIETLAARYRLPEVAYVTRPTMPSLDAYTQLLQTVWERRWLTNDGELHQQLEKALTNYLQVEHLSLFCNATIALLVSLQALRINSGEVITTPFTFPATPHVLYWNRVRPVFCDIDPHTYNLDPKRVEAAITPDTKAILGVHVYGNPCDVEALRDIADRHGLAIIYDAAHVFGVRYKGRSLLEYGDMSILSFHATKLFSTAEGGAVISRTAAQQHRVNSLKNFGIADEETVIGPGINGKMNEFQAAFGLLQLAGVDQEIALRHEIVKTYREGLRDVPGITFLDDIPDVTHNYAYFPIEVDAAVYGMDRESLFQTLKRFSIHTRKYFHLLCTHFSCYSALPSSDPHNLPVAERVAKRILCLPLYGTLGTEHAATIAHVITELGHIGA